MPYVIKVQYEDRVRFLNWDECGYHSTSVGKARTFSDLGEAKETLQKVKSFFRGADLKVLPTGEARVWRKVVQKDRKMEEHTSVQGRMFSWRAIPVTTLYLECGHKKVIRGDKVPQKRTTCQECEEKALL